MSTKHIAEYFNFLSSEDIRLKDSRIGIETILYEYIDCGRSPEEIAQNYQTISLEQVYATILYYLQNKETVSAYIKNWIEHGHRMREEQRLNPSPPTPLPKLGEGSKFSSSPSPNLGEGVRG